MRSYIPCNVGSEEKVFLTKNISKTLLNKRNTYLLKILYHLAYLYFHFPTTLRQVLPQIIKKVNISEELYIQQLIYRSRSNPEPREKLILIIFPSL